ncbi:ABC transporter A family member 7-like protein [Tanacetum coccineum]
MSVKYPNYVNLTSSCEEQPNERTPSPPSRKKSLSPPQAPSKSISRKSTHYTSSSSPNKYIEGKSMQRPPLFESDSENDAEGKTNDETCLMAQSSNEGDEVPEETFLESFNHSSQVAFSIAVEKPNVASVQDVIYTVSHCRAVATSHMPSSFNRRFSIPIPSLANGGVANMQAGKYRGGMKRRLSVSFSQIGDLKVVYMDEPNTGLEPASSNNPWNVVKLAKQNHAIILTSNPLFNFILPLLAKHHLGACCTYM